MENLVWIRKIASVIREFSSKEYQDRVWVKGLGPEVSSYEEAMCKLFDDLGFSRLIDVEWRQVGLNESQIAELKKFREKLLNFDKDVPEIPRPKDIIERSSWNQICECASKALESLELK